MPPHSLSELIVTRIKEDERRLYAVYDEYIDALFREKDIRFHCIDDADSDAIARTIERIDGKAFAYVARLRAAIEQAAAEAKKLRFTERITSEITATKQKIHRLTSLMEQHNDPDAIDSFSSSLERAKRRLYWLELEHVKELNTSSAEDNPLSTEHEYEG